MRVYVRRLPGNNPRWVGAPIRVDLKSKPPE